MASEKTFRIDLPTLFATVNRRRQESGLPAVEPAVMAVRASIKFAIRKRRHIDLKGEELDIPESDVQSLCDTLGELFNVTLDAGHASGADQAPVSGGTVASAAGSSAVGAPATGTLYQLPLAAFYAAFNKERRAKGLMPVEPAIISVRTGVKFAIMRHRPIELQATRAMVDREDIKALEQILVQQFDVSLPGGLASLCEAVEPAKNKVKAAATPSKEGKQSSVIARLASQIAGGRERTRRYSLDTNSLLLAILKRRSAMGYKPIPPELIRKKCAQNLRVELQLETDLRDPGFELSGEHMDAFAEMIRREFQIIFDDLEDLMDQPAKGGPARKAKPKR